MLPFPTTELEYPLTPDQAFAFCASVTNAHYENFPVASVLLPTEKRPYLQAIYAFARAADDFADEPGLTAHERLSLLANWQRQLDWCYQDTAAYSTGGLAHPIFIALKETVNRLNIPPEPLRHLLSAFNMDVTKNRYSSFDELLHYCRHSANPVGRIVLMIFGYRNEELFSLSDKICTGLQLANFWQDVAIDLKKDRVYIPTEDLERFGYSLEELAGGIVNERFRALMKYEIDRTRQFFAEGASLPTLVDKDLRLELRLIWFGGASILRKTERLKFDIFRRRPRLHAGNKFMIFLNGLFRRDLARYLKPKKDLWDLT